jgi:hypothetical protein
VDERLATLDAVNDWQPDAGAALARFRGRQDARGALAQRCLNCSVALLQTLAATGAGRAKLIAARSSNFSGPLQAAILKCQACRWTRTAGNRSGRT